MLKVNEDFETFSKNCPAWRINRCVNYGGCLSDKCPRLVHKENVLLMPEIDQKWYGRYCNIRTEKEFNRFVYDAINKSLQGVIKNGN